MDSLSLVLSLTSRRNIVSKLIADPVLIPEIGYGDVISGRASIVSETGDPTEPTTGVVITGGGVSVTDGLGTVYASSPTPAVQNSNDLVFTLTVTGTALAAALAAVTADFLPAFLEVQATISGGNVLVIKEPITILKV
jgi:hypothetical protein